MGANRGRLEDVLSVTSSAAEGSSRSDATHLEVGGRANTARPCDPLWPLLRLESRRFHGDYAHASFGGVFDFVSELVDSVP